MLDHTHDPKATSWEVSANGHSDFPVQNLPFGVFSRPGKPPRGGVAIGDMILDLELVHTLGLVPDDAAKALDLARRPVLNDFLALGAPARTALRRALFDILVREAPARPGLLVKASECMQHMPLTVGDYTDFYAGYHHALNVGRMLRPEAPLAPNYLHLPVGYHGRVSTLKPSGTPLRRPSGQRKPARDPEPSFGPSRNLDYELELGIWVGRGTPLGRPIPISEAAQHIGGYCLLNDWSARDIQGWEANPLGPFLGKSFLTTVSPWIVTPEALAPHRIAQPARPDDAPAMMDYLIDARDQDRGALNLALEAYLITPGFAAAGLPPHLLSRTHATAMFWTAAQLVTQQSSNGCELNTGDMIGSGTLSGPTPESAGSLLELTQGGRKPIPLASGETRRFLEDGDTVLLSAHTTTPGHPRLGFGLCVGTVLPG